VTKFFIFYREPDSAGISFNEAAAILKKYKDIKILASWDGKPSDAIPNEKSFMFHTPDAVADQIEQQLKEELVGWRSFDEHNPPPPRNSL